MEDDFKIIPDGMGGWIKVPSMETISTNNLIINPTAPVPEVGQKLHFWDDGKSGDSRHFLAVVTHILTPKQAKSIYCEGRMFIDDNTPDIELLNKSRSLVDLWEKNKKEYDWIFKDETDYFVGCAIPEYDEHIIWFARDKRGEWFSLDIQSSWQGGFLDVTGEKYENNVKEGYKYSERI